MIEFVLICYVIFACVAIFIGQYDSRCQRWNCQTGKIEYFFRLVKTEVKAKSRKLKTNWTTELTEDLKYHGKDS